MIGKIQLEIGAVLLALAVAAPCAQARKAKTKIKILKKDTRDRPTTFDEDILKSDTANRFHTLREQANPLLTVTASNKTAKAPPMVVESLVRKAVSVSGLTPDQAKELRKKLTPKLDRIYQTAGGAEAKTVDMLHAMHEALNEIGVSVEFDL